MIRRRLAVALLTGLVAFSAAAAKWERIGVARVADESALTAAVVQLSAYTGNPAVGMMLASAPVKAPYQDFFGPARPKASVAFVLLEDVEAPADNLAIGFEYAVLYPVAQTKADFVKAHRGCVETNGFLRVPKVVSEFDDGVDDSEDYDDQTFDYVKFSADGKWAATSDKAEQVDLALAECAAAAQPMDGDLARVQFDEKGIGYIAALLAKVQSAVEDASSRQEMERVRNLLAGCENGVGGIRLTERGIEQHFEVTVRAGSELAKLSGLAASNALASASADALLATESFKGENVAEYHAQLAELLRKYGFDLSSVSCRRKPTGARLEVDLAALVKYMMTDAKKAFENFDSDRFEKDLKKIKAQTTSQTNSVETTFELALKGCRPRLSPAARLAKTLPECAGKRTLFASVCSLSGVVCALAPVLLDQQPEQVRSTLKPLLATMGTEAETGCAAAGWFDGRTFRGLARLSADELKSVCNAVSAVFGYMMMNAAAEADDDDDDDDD